MRLLLLLAVASPLVAADPADLARRIDARLAAAWEREGVKPAPAADDAEFLRRAHLDLVGRIPTTAETRAFLADPDPSKRDKLVDRLLLQPGHATHYSRVWRARWLPQSAVQFEELKPEFEGWLLEQLRSNAPYDRMVRTLLAAPDGPGTGRSAKVFLQANEYKPANLAGNTARTFLGLNLDCAQCHDHPFARWTKEQFWSFGAFFADPTRDSAALKLTLPNSTKLVSAKFVDGSEPRLPIGATAAAGRAALADWLVSPKNPYFARNAVNRVWADLFGSGLAEPLDDLSGAVEPHHPELLDEIASAFADSGFDLRFLLRALTRTRAYRLSSAAPGPGPPQQLFARFALRPMTGDQLYDSLMLAAGLVPNEADRAALRIRFGQPERPSEAGRTILQSLTLMNGKTVREATSLEGRGTLAAVADAPFLDAAGKVESLFLAAVSRPPTAEESKRLVALVEKDPRRALASIFWALLNGHEFATIH